MAWQHSYLAGLALLSLVVIYPPAVQAQAGRLQAEQHDRGWDRPGVRRHGPGHDSRPYGPDYDMRRYGPEPRQPGPDLDRRLDERNQRDRPAPPLIQPDDDRRSTIAPSRD